MSVLMLPIVAVIGLLVLAGLVMMVVLLANPKTRAAGFVTLGLGMFLLVVGAGAVLVLFTDRDQVETQTQIAARKHMMNEAMRHARHREVIVTPMPTSPDPVAAESNIEVFEEVQRVMLPATEADASTVPAEDDSAPAETETPAPEHPTAEQPEASTPEESIATEQRPAWVDLKPGMVDGVYQMVVKVGPYTTPQECDVNMGPTIRRAVGQYMVTYLSAAGRVQLTPEIYEQIVQETWEQTQNYSVGPMIERYVRLKFDHKARKLIETERNRAIVSERLWYTGAAVVGTLLLLSLLYAGLRIDAATGGGYRGRVALAGAVLLMFLVGLVFFFFMDVASTHYSIPPAPVPARATAGALPGATIDNSLLAESGHGAARSVVVHPEPSVLLLLVTGLTLALGVLLAWRVGLAARGRSPLAHDPGVGDGHGEESKRWGHSSAGKRRWLSWWLLALAAVGAAGVFLI